MTKSTNQNANKLVQRQIKDLQNKSKLLANEDLPGLETPKQYVEHNKMFDGYTQIFTDRKFLLGADIKSLAPGFYTVADPINGPEAKLPGGAWSVTVSKNGNETTYYASSEYSNRLYTLHVRREGSNKEHTITEWQRLTTETILWSGSATSLNQKLMLLEDIGHYSGFRVDFQVFDSHYTAFMQYYDPESLNPLGYNVSRIFGANLNNDSATTKQYADFTEAELTASKNTLTITAINHFSLNLTGVTAAIDNVNHGLMIKNIIGLN